MFQHRSSAFDPRLTAAQARGRPFAALAVAVGIGILIGLAARRA